jgi:hypothetical protein
VVAAMVVPGTDVRTSVPDRTAAAPVY